MDAIQHSHNQLSSKANLSKALRDVDTLISLLQNTRDNIAASPDMTALHTAKLKNPLKQSFDRIEDDLKDVNKGLNQYQKALKDKFKVTSLPTAGLSAFGGGGGGGGGGAGDEGGAGGLGTGSQKGLVDRAIAMHLLREGKFDVASTFVKEVNAQAQREAEEAEDGMMVDGGAVVYGNSWVDDFADQDEAMGDEYDDEHDEELYGELGKGRLQKKFAEMYHILDALRNQHNLTPAIDWAHHHSQELETRGSNLEFELSRLKFIELYTNAGSTEKTYSGPLQALQYAQTTFPTFGPRHSRDVAALLGALAYSPDLAHSPYATLFLNQSSWEDVSTSFTREFTLLLGLPSSSPLHTAVTAGGIALPILEKVERIMTQTRGQWTSVNELPVETPLPPGFLFHSIFVCPVSKEQATDVNPPMMLPCGHVIAKESLEMHARGKQRVKCPYCPVECVKGEAMRVYI